MSVFDIVFVILFAWSGYKGFSKGLIKTLAGLVALVAGIWGAIKFSEFTSGILTKTFELNSEYLPVISFAVTFIAIIAGIHILALFLDKVMESVALGLFNKLLGLLFNILKIAFILSIVLMLINNLNYKYNFIPKEKTDESVLWKPISSIAPLVFPYLNFDKIKKSIEIKKEEPEIKNNDNQQEV